MELVTGNMKRLLRERRLTIGTWITINDPDVTEALSSRSLSSRGPR